MKTLGFLVIATKGLLVSAWNFFLHTYQKVRILTLLNPGHDPMGAGYNSLQSLVAIGSGSFWGKGFKQGTQTQLQFLPAKHTDFIFSVFSEENGFLGSCFIFLLFFVFEISHFGCMESAGMSICCVFLGSSNKNI